ncbi:MAG: amidase family protein, partial [Bordetella sp.]
MNSSELCFLSVAETALLIRTGKISPVELTRSLLDRISRLDNRVQAFITLTAEPALAQAREAEQEIRKGRYRGPLHGIPFGLKDIYDTAGLL